MSGHAVLSGKRAQRACEMLRAVADVLEKAGVRYWLDSGTLLGIVREQRLLPWDTDMDISVDSEHVPALLACTARLKRLGLRVRVRHHSSDEPKLNRQSVRIIKVRDRKWLFFRGELLLDVFIQYRIDNHYCWTLSRKGSDIRMSAPARFFDTLDTVEFHGKHYPIPSNAPAYLRHRYGNWQTPVKTWSVYTDDLALHASETSPAVSAEEVFTP